MKRTGSGKQGKGIKIWAIAIAAGIALVVVGAIYLVIVLAGNDWVKIANGLAIIGGILLVCVLAWYFWGRKVLARRREARTRR